MASQADVASVAYDMREMARELGNKTTFPGDDKDQRRFLEVVRAWAKVEWTEMTWGQVARKMTAMLPELREVCALSCANLWFAQKIHRIHGLVEGIVEWLAQAGARKEAREKAEEEEEEEAAAAYRVVQAFETVSVVTKGEGGAETVSVGVVLTAQSREAL